jgi:hypothetical protein
MSKEKQTTLVHLKCMTVRYIKQEQENIRKIVWSAGELFFNGTSTIPKDRHE